MTHKEIYNKLQIYKSIDRIQLVRADYKGTDEGFNEQLTNMINELESDYDFKYYKRLNDLCMILDKVENENDLDRIKNIESQIKSHEKTILNPFLVSLRKEIEDYIKQTETQKLETKGILTNETYYNLLENCTIEAFESLKIKELYPRNGAKAIWDVSTLEITKGDGLPTDKDNELFRKEYILDNMRVTFLIVLDKICKDFEIKHSIIRSFFYKKCFQSILFKASQSPMWHEPDFGFDIDKEPSKLNFIWNMRVEIEARSKEVKQNPPQQIKTIKPDEEYKKQNLFKLGMLFAKGEMNKYFTVNSKNATVMNNEFSAPKIARDIKEKLRTEINHKFISASINNYTPNNANGNKNIFNSSDMMTEIISECEARKFPVDAYFKSRLPIE